MDLVGLIFVVIFGIELAGVMFGDEQALTARHNPIGPHGQPIQEEGRWGGKVELQGVVVYFGHLRRLPAGDHVVRGHVRVIGIEHHVFPPIQEIIHGEGFTVGPLGPFPEAESPFSLVCIGIPTLSQARAFVQAVLHPVYGRVAIHSHSQMTAIGGGVEAVPGAAVLADLAIRLDHQWVYGDAFLQGGQFAG